MNRILLIICAAVLVAGCQVQDPFAVLGPPRVPAPKTAQTTPYYPATADATKPATPPPPSNSPRISVSAEDNRLAPSVASRVSIDANDREPIRIVERNNLGTRQ